MASEEREGRIRLSGDSITFYGLKSGLFPVFGVFVLWLLYFHTGILVMLDRVSHRPIKILPEIHTWPSTITPLHSLWSPCPRRAPLFLLVISLETNQCTHSTFLFCWYSCDSVFKGMGFVGSLFGNLWVITIMYKCCNQLLVFLLSSWVLMLVNVVVMTDHQGQLRRLVLNPRERRWTAFSWAVSEYPPSPLTPHSLYGAGR